MKEVAFIEAFEMEQQEVYTNVAPMFNQPVSEVLAYITGGGKVITKLQC